MQPRLLLAAFAARAHCCPFSIKQECCIIFYRAAFQQVGRRPLLVHGLFASWMQDLTSSYIEHHEVPVCIFVQSVEVPLNGGSTTTWCIKHSAQSCITLYHIICVKLVEGTSCFIIKVINEDIKHDWIQYCPLGYTTDDWTLCC